MLYVCASLFLYIGVVHIDYALAKSGLYKKCIFADESVESAGKGLIVRPVGDTCYNNCQNQCAKLFGIKGINSESVERESDHTLENYPYPDGSDSGDLDGLLYGMASSEGIIAANYKNIAKCLQQCMEGEDFRFNGEICRAARSGDKNTDTSNPYICDEDLEGAVGGCSRQMTDGGIAYPYKYEGMIRKGDKITVEINYTDIVTKLENTDILGQHLMNFVSTCGYQSKTRDAFLYVNNYSTKLTDCSDVGDGHSWSICKGWYNTNISVKDGDYLDIKYYGQYGYTPDEVGKDDYIIDSDCWKIGKCNQGSKCMDSSQRLDVDDGSECGESECSGGGSDVKDKRSCNNYSLLIKNPNDDDSHYFLNGNGLASRLLSIPRIVISQYTKHGRTQGEYNNAVSDLIEMDYCMYNEYACWYKSNNNKSEIDLPKGSKYNLSPLGGLAPGHPGIGSDVELFTKDIDLLLNVYSNKSYTVHRFSGIVENFSGKREDLQISHYHNIGKEDEGYAVGGYNVELHWKGCIKQPEEALEYVIVPKSQYSNALELADIFSNPHSWKEVKSGNGGNQDCGDDCKEEQACYCLQNDIEEDGFLFFRIKVDIKNDNDDDNNDSADNADGNWSKDHSNLKYLLRELNSRSLSSGFYNISVSKVEAASGKVHTNFIDKLIDQIKALFFGQGANDKDGSSAKGFYAIAVNSDFLDYVRVFVACYVVFIALTLIMGFSQMTQVNALIHIIKISVMVLLISKPGMSTIYHVLYNIFVSGMDDMIDIFTYRTDGVYANRGIHGITAITHNLLSDLFSIDKWNRIFALFFASLPFIGGGANVIVFAIAILCIWAILNASIACMRTVLIYLISLLGIAVLISIAPLFISFILFPRTKPMFDAWLKQLLSFMLEPVLVCATVSLFLGIFQIIFDHLLSFSICQTPLITFTIFNMITINLLNVYVPLFTSHNPDIFFSPMILFTSALAITILSQTLYVASEIGTQIAQYTVSYMGMISGNVANYTGMLQDYQGAKAMRGAPREAVKIIAGSDDKSKAKRADDAKKYAEKRTKDYKKYKKNEAKK